MIKIEPTIPLLEEIFVGWKSVIGSEYAGYRNHVYRMIHFCFALKECSEEERHKIRAYTGSSYPLVEVFRQADLVDFSFGLFKFGLDKADIEAVKTEFSNADFHKNLAQRAGKWFLKHPLNPVPMMKW